MSIAVPVLIAGCLSLTIAAGAAAQTAQQPPPTQTAQSPPPAQTAQKKPPPARPTATITVTDAEGNPVPEVHVRMSGPVDREATTDAQGTVTFRNMTAGAYRLRFEAGEYVTLERDVTVQAGRALRVEVSLSSAPAAATPVAPEPEPVRTPEPAPLPPAGPPTSMSVIDFLDKNFVGRAPLLISRIGCAPSATSTLIQLRDPLEQHTHAEADEMLYVVAGDGTHRVGGREVPLSTGVFAVVPRGTPHSITRRGSRPIIVLSVLSGQPCEP